MSAVTVVFHVARGKYVSIVAIVTFATISLRTASVMWSLGPMLVMFERSRLKAEYWICVLLGSIECQALEPDLKPCKYADLRIARLAPWPLSSVTPK